MTHFQHLLNSPMFLLFLQRDSAFSIMWISQGCSSITWSPESLLFLLVYPQHTDCHNNSQPSFLSRVSLLLLKNSYLLPIDEGYIPLPGFQYLLSPPHYLYLQECLFFPDYKNSSLPPASPPAQLDSNTIYLEMKSDPTGQNAQSCTADPTSEANSRSRLCCFWPTGCKSGRFQDVLFSLE